ncbi:hypothetical protein C161_27613 [Paenibacillus sp. FSL R5-192]|uniref:hypothetical protein n=1 Tax=Paenibacillus sp. FSL R5-192 TaxID=1226754 RepID=UPI0003E1C45C|nr:hypothetical protein [Paenibacillus sp. FSL R5-192]ETT30296.1 hypothetical protein C161_27613 [Paenibacillus sp. FSL R5-192]
MFTFETLLLFLVVLAVLALVVLPIIIIAANLKDSRSEQEANANRSIELDRKQKEWDAVEKGLAHPSTVLTPEALKMRSIVISNILRRLGHGQMPVEDSSVRELFGSLVMAGHFSDIDCVDVQNIRTSTMLLRLDSYSREIILK